MKRRIVNAVLRLLGIDLHVLVAVDRDGKHAVVEMHEGMLSVRARTAELVASGIPGRRISAASRSEIVPPGGANDRKWGPAWKEGTGWTPGPAGEGDPAEMSANDTRRAFRPATPAEIDALARGR